MLVKAKHIFLLVMLHGVHKHFTQCVGPLFDVSEFVRLCVLFACSIVLIGILYLLLSMCSLAELFTLVS